MARFLHMSDLHVVAPGRLCSGVLDTRALLRNAVDLLLERRAALGPLDAVLVTGDVSDDGSPESYAYARAELDRLGLPVLAVPGNHDTREAFRRGFADLSFMPGSGLIDWRAEIAGTMLVGLDTLIEGHGGGRLRPDSLSHLADMLAQAGPRPVVVMLHHPPLRTGIRFMDAIGLDGIPALAAVLGHAMGDVVVIAGHVHGVHHGRIGRHPVATAPAICSAFALDLRADAPVGFMSGPKGCAVLDTDPGCVWSAVSLDPSEGPFAF